MVSPRFANAASRINTIGETLCLPTCQPATVETWRAASPCRGAAADVSVSDYRCRVSVFPCFRGSDASRRRGTPRLYSRGRTYLQTYCRTYRVYATCKDVACRVSVLHASRHHMKKVGNPLGFPTVYNNRLTIVRLSSDYRTTTFTVSPSPSGETTLNRYIPPSSPATLTPVDSDGSAISFFTGVPDIE